MHHGNQEKGYVRRTSGRGRALQNLKRRAGAVLNSSQSEADMTAIFFITLLMFTFIFIKVFIVCNFKIQLLLLQGLAYLPTI